MVIFNGCWWDKECKPKIEYVDRVVIQKVPVKCSVPISDCSWYGTDTEVVVGMYQCIVELKENSKVCE